MAKKLNCPAPATRRPPGSQVVLPPHLTGPAEKSAGGPQTRGETTLGRMLADLLAFFEVRQVTAKEIDLVRPTHRNGWLRVEIEAKLAKLHPTCPDHQELRRLVLLCLDLLTAIDQKRFDPGEDWAELEPRLLRALAYFVRAGDAIPDHLPHGFDDDIREFRGFAKKASSLFSKFELARWSDRASSPSA